MKSLILCEGKTDAILISYLLCKQWGWSWISPKNKRFKNYQIDVSEINNESAEWYIKDNNELLICGVGGNANFSNFFEDKISSIQVNYNEEDIFKNIICVIDKDNLEVVDIERKFCSSFSIISIMKNNSWEKNTYKLNGFENDVSINALLLIIPNESEGALETILLDSIAENSYDKVIVDDVEDFVNLNRNKYSKYLYNNRLLMKSKLGAVFAIMSPQKVFTFIDEIIRSVDWEKSTLLLNLFEKLGEI